jgi:hypothetical protein
MGRKSRHYRDESDPLLGFYHQTLAATSSIRSSSPLYSSSSPPSFFTSKKRYNPTNNEHETAANTAQYQSPLSSTAELTDESDVGGGGNGNSDDNVSFADVENVNNKPKGHHRVHSYGYYKPQKNYDAMSKSERNRSKKKKKKPGYRVHRVSYTPHDHIQVMFRMYGSAFPSVFPFVVVNIAWSLLVFWLKNLDIIDLTFHSSAGHSFMGLLVSFLIVSRSQIAYQRYMEFRKLLAQCYQYCREIAQFTTVYTNYTNTSSARRWRLEVCYRTCLLLRVTMDALLWSSTSREEWEEEYYQYRISGTKNVPSISSTECEDDEDEEMATLMPQPSRQLEDEGENDDVSEHFFRFRDLTHGRRSQVDENFRAPITSLFVLRNVSVSIL